MNGRADGDHFIGVDALVRRFATEAVGDLNHLGHAGHATDQHKFVDLRRAKLRVLQAILKRLHTTLEELIADLLHLGPRELEVEMLRSGGIRRDERQVDFDRLRGRKRDLGLLGLFFEPLERHRVFAKIDAVFFFESLNQPRDQCVVPIVTAEVSVSVGRLHFKDAVANFEDGYVESTAAQIEYRDFLVLLLIQAVGERCCRGLVNNTQDFQAGYFPGILGRLTLRIIKISRNRDHGLGDLLAKVSLGIGFEFTQYKSGNLLRRELLRFVSRLHLDVGVTIFAFNGLERHVFGLFAHLGELATDETLGRENGVARIRDSLPLGGLADQTFARFCKSDHGGSGAGSLGVRNNDGFPAFHDGHTRICSA